MSSRPLGRVFHSLPGERIRTGHASCRGSRNRFVPSYSSWPMTWTRWLTSWRPVSRRMPNACGRERGRFVPSGCLTPSRRSRECFRTKTSSPLSHDRMRRSRLLTTFSPCWRPASSARAALDSSSKNSKSSVSLPGSSSRNRNVSLMRPGNF